jgi:hypothetical protein
VHTVKIRENYNGAEFIATLETYTGDVEGMGESIPEALRDLANNMDESSM